MFRVVARVICLICKSYTLLWLETLRLVFFGFNYVKASQVGLHVNDSTRNQRDNRLYEHFPHLWCSKRV